jgi:hypothetical protein
VPSRPAACHDLALVPCPVFLCCHFPLRHRLNARRLRWHGVIDGGGFGSGAVLNGQSLYRIRPALRLIYGTLKAPLGGSNLIKDLLRYFVVKSCFDPMTGLGTCRDVCRELGIYCWSSDLHEGMDACDATQFPRACFEFAWLHPPYWCMKRYCDDPRDLSRTTTLDAIL